MRILPIIPKGPVRICLTRKIRRMNRLTTLTLGIVALTWATGCCCHKYQSSCVDWDDGCRTDNVDDCRQKHGRHRDRNCRDDRCREDRRGDRRRDENGCYPTDCCETGGAPGTFAPSAGSYDTGAMMGGSGCSGCSGGMPAMSVPTSGGCASGNCGASMPTYGGQPIDPSSGWTIVPSPGATGSEPVQAPPSGNNQTPASPTSAMTPVPMPIAPPAGSGR